MSIKIFLKPTVKFCIKIFMKFLYDLKENIFHLIRSTYSVAYYSIFWSIFWGSFVHIYPFPGNKYNKQKTIHTTITFFHSCFILTNAK
jgi:hypothetical protein